MKYRVHFFTFFAVASILSSCGNVPEETSVTKGASENEVHIEFSDNSSRGDYSIEAVYKDCVANFYIYNSELNESRYVEAQTPQCEVSKLSQSEITEIQREQLETLFKQWPIEEISSINWPNPMYDKDHSWIFPIAKASAKSEEYAEYRKNYPHAENNSIHAIFGKLAEEENAYQYTKELFAEFDVDITLESTEKMGTSLVSEIRSDELRVQLLEAGLSENERVIVGPAVHYFELKRIR